MQVSIEGNKRGYIAYYLNSHVKGQKNLLILHGALGASDRLMYLAGGLSSYNLLWCDIKGHGLSTHVDNGYDPTSLAYDLLEVIALIFAQEPFSILGESFSGIVGLELAKLLLQVQCVIMADTPLDNGRIPSTLTALLNAHHRQVKKRPAIASFSRDFFGFDVLSGKAKPREFFIRFANVQVPILMITGSRKAWDQPSLEDAGAYFIPADSKKIQKYTQRFSWVEIKDAGHLLLKTHMEQAVPIVIDMLEHLPS
jgi:pimeloyl-ACP methyl ester carboxylesterase